VSPVGDLIPGQLLIERGQTHVEKTYPSIQFGKKLGLNASNCFTPFLDSKSLIGRANTRMPWW